MNVDTWMAHAETAAGSRTGSAERTCAWTHVAQAVALSEIGSATPGRTTDAVWVAPAMAWTLDDLADAGVASPAPQMPPVPSGLERALLIASLRRLLTCAAEEAPTAPLRVVDACAQAARRASLALEQLTGALP